MSIVVFDRIFMVKNMSSNDANNSNVLLLPHPLDNSKEMSSLDLPPIGVTAGMYKCVQVANNFSFDGTEDYAQLMTYEEYEHNQFNPIFFDLTNIPDIEIGVTLEKLGAGPSNELLISSIIRKVSVGPLFKGSLWSNADKIAFNDYWHRAWNFAGLGNVGALLNMMLQDKAILDGGGTITTIDRAGNVVNVNQLTSVMLQEAIDLCLIYKMKFPDGSI
jgi:hypothetical protein